METRIDTTKLTDIENRIFEILGEHKIREAQLTAMIYKQSLEIETLRRELKAHKNNIDEAHKI